MADGRPTLADDEIEVTPEMIEAGEDAYFSYSDLGKSFALEAAYRAMREVDLRRIQERN